MSRVNHRSSLFVTVLALATCWFLVTKVGQFAAIHEELANLSQAISGSPRLLALPVGAEAPQPLAEYPMSPREESRLDPDVRPAAMIASPNALPFAVAGNGNSLEITAVSQGDFTWPVTAQVTSIELRDGNPITISGNGPEGNVELVEPKTEPKKAGKVEAGKWSIGDIKISAATDVTVKAGGISSASIKVIPPRESLWWPRVTEVANNSYGAGEAFSKDKTVNVFNRYLRLSGQNVPPNGDLEFLVFRNETGTGNLVALAPATDLQTEPDGTWKVVLRMPMASGSSSGDQRDFFVGDTGRVAVRSRQTAGGPHAFAAEVVRFKVSKPDVKTDPTLSSLAVISADRGDRINSRKGAWYSNRLSFWASGEVDPLTPNLADGRVVFLVGTRRQVLESVAAPTKKNTKMEWQANLTLPQEGTHELHAAWAFGNEIVQPSSEPAIVHVRTGGPRVVNVEPINFASTPNAYKVTVTFDEPIDPKVVDGVNSAADKSATAFQLAYSNGSKVSLTGGTPARLSEDGKSVVLSFVNFTPDQYKFTVARSITDLFENGMDTDYSVGLLKPIGDELAGPTPGIPGPTGPYVEFGEYTTPRPFIDGFNASDHVETRVSRLYYYRDAHRVAQIVNRDSRSHNRAAVDMHQQLADKARTIADQATDDRRAKEREAVRTSQLTREAERELQQAEARAQRAADEAANANAELQRKHGILVNPPQPLSEQDGKQLQADVQRLPDVIASLESVAEAARRQAQAAYDKVQQLRAREAVATETWQASIAAEDRAREEQFRREVAAANVDPDTYAPGVPDSKDPVRQVSVSVIGEGLIQLRGPLKGINIIRTMINQIDAPVGQVRVSVHTVQINGEKGDRMEQVAGRIQRYIDHSRFLTLQSAEMLRKAIVTVAAQRATELGDCSGLTQEERDRKYLHSFFGEDFVRELEVMDSEFLKTGNKLLSIHSMDSTSLASALFMMALAKNSTRMEILQTFDGMLGGDLPLAEQSYFEAGLTCDGKHRLFDKYCKRSDFQLLSGNARFQSIRGLFDGEIAADDTMTPIQREFTRLAQIFKSRLIVEMELKQRIMERSVIEERLGNRQKELEDARKKEDVANGAREKSLSAVKDAQKEAKKTVVAIRAVLPVVQGEVDGAITEAESYVAFLQHAAISMTESLKAQEKGPFALLSPASQTQFSKDAASARAAFMRPVEADGSSMTLGERLRELRRSLVSACQRLPEFQNKNLQEELNSQQPINLVAAFGTPNRTIEITVPQGSVEATADDKGTKVLSEEVGEALAVADRLSGVVARFVFDRPHHEELERANRLLVKIKMTPEAKTVNDCLFDMRDALEILISLGKYLTQEQLATIDTQVLDIDSALGRPDADLDEIYRRWLGVERQFADKTILGTAPAAFQRLGESNLDYQFALREAEAARRPLDHKKFLDMLVDEMEDKYIELLEGTRAHTANIDAYIKRLITSLDDDLNTQFYYPTFRKVREASQLWDVQMGQVETTNVLANNRAFAKVTPEATMEFDLPKRDIVITEAIDGAKAMIDDVGALAQDPTFLAMAKLGSGQPTSSLVPGASGGLATVRNVLPGLSTDTAEAVLGQQGPGGSQFGAALEGLIPDPAIYKFETGTGWEIRPVIQPDGQAVVFHFNYMYSTNIREPVRADEKHLGRVKRHFVDTDVQLSNFELREVSRYTVALKAARTSRGVPLLEDIPLAGVLFRPLPSDESSLQQNIILSQATIFPTLFDLMGLRWAPAVADLDPLRLSNDEFIVRGRRQALMNRVFDHSSSQVDEFLRIPEGERRMDLYRSQESIPSVHPNGYSGPGANLRDSQLQEGYAPTDREPTYPVPGESAEGRALRSPRPQILPPSIHLDPADGGEPVPPADQGSGQGLEAVPTPTPDRPGARTSSAEHVRPAVFSEPARGVVTHVSDLQPVHVSGNPRPSLPVRPPVVRLVPQANGYATSN